VLAEASWFPAVGDGASGNLGSGCVTRERAALNIGTSGALRIAWKADAVNIPRGLWCYRADRRRFVLGGALSNGGNLYAWMQDTLNLGPPEEIDARLEQMGADEHGLTVLPFLSGERSTGWAAHARAAVIGLSLDSRPLHILRAGLEAVAYRIAAVYDLLAREVGPPVTVIASGAAVLRSPAWAQIISDVIGKEIIASAESETSSRGAALQVLEALKLIPDIEQVETAPGRVYSPDSARHARYVEARQRQDQLYDAIIARSDPFRERSSHE
jgi:gluconokinase